MIPHVRVTGVTVYENHCRTVQISCPYCGLTHTHDWPVGELIIGLRVAPCDPTRNYDVDLPEWAYNSRHRKSYAKAAVIQRSSVDDGAIDDPANNWEE